MKSFAFVPVLLSASLAAAAPPPRANPPPRAPREAVAPRRDAGPRAVGVHVVPNREAPMHAVNNPPHQVVYHVGGHEERHPVIIEHRPGHVIGRDPHVRIIRRGYHPVHAWGHFHPVRGGWFHLWGISSWDNVGTVTCEAANESTGELFPVTMDRDGNGWDDDTVNSALDQALDDCMAESGGAQCTPVSPACSFQEY